MAKSMLKKHKNNGQDPDGHEKSRLIAGAGTDSDISTLSINESKSEEEQDNKKIKKVLYTLGNIYKKEDKKENEPQNDDEKKEKQEDETKIWFIEKPDKKTKRRVFVSFKVKRISRISLVEQSFRLWFHIYFSWMMTAEEYKTYNELDEKEKKQYYPDWYPQMEFTNLAESHYQDWEEYPDGSKFRVYSFGKDEFPPEYLDNPDFDSSKAKFIRAKLSCDITFAEIMEIENFPFDCQDISVYSQERTKKALFLPELRVKKNEVSFFGHIDPTTSDITEWTLQSAFVTLQAQSKSRRSKSSYPGIILKLKLQRKWSIECQRTGFTLFVLSGLLLTQFTLDPIEDKADRLGLGVTFLLTYVAYIQIVFDRLPNVPYITFMEYYILCGITFSACIMIEAASVDYFDEQHIDLIDNIFWGLFVFAFVLYNIIFVYLAYKNLKYETKKLTEYDPDINDDYIGIPLVFDPLNQETISNEHAYIFKAKQNPPKKPKST